jgi:integrase
MSGRGHIKKRSSDSWSIVISAGVDPSTGKRRRVWRTVRGTKKQAMQQLTKLLAENDQGMPPTAGNTKLVDYLREWIDSIVKHRNTARTMQGYSTICREHIVPACGEIPLHQLQPFHIDRLMNSILEKGRSANTANHVFTVLRKALNDAERRGAIARNPCRLTSPPRMTPYIVEQPSVEHVKDVLELARLDGRYGSIIEFMARTGVRRGEAVAIKWHNLDLDRGVAEIVESASRVTGVGLVMSPTKTTSGRRTLYLDTRTISLLRRWRARQASQVLAGGAFYDDDGFVYANELGKPLDPDHLSHAFKKHARAAEHPRLRLHDLRHFHAFGLIATNAHPKIVQERLGHSSAAFTMQVYGHGSELLQRDATEKFASFLDA